MEVKPSNQLFQFTLRFNLKLHGTPTNELPTGPQSSGHVSGAVALSISIYLDLWLMYAFNSPRPI